MKVCRHLGVLIFIIGIVQIYRNIHISFSSAQAALDFVIPMSENQPVEGSNRLKSEPRTPANQDPQKILGSNNELSIHSQLVQLIQQDRLCDFINLSKEKNLSKKIQVSAFESSFIEAKYKDLFSLLDEKQTGKLNYGSALGRATMLGKALGAFEKPVLQIQTDYRETGLSENDKYLLSEIKALQLEDPGNLFYSFLKMQIFKKYKNRSEALMESLFDEVMATSHYNNPAFQTLQNLYSDSKTATQFHLASEFFSKKFFSHTYFITVSVWFFPSIEARSHVAKILGEFIDQYHLSTKAFGYDPGVYKGHRMVLPFDEYFSFPSLEEFEASRQKPSFSIEELKIDLSQGCQEHLVEELKIKLRAL